MGMFRESPFGPVNTRGVGGSWVCEREPDERLPGHQKWPGHWVQRCPGPSGRAGPQSSHRKPSAVDQSCTLNKFKRRGGVCVVYILAAVH